MELQWKKKKFYFNHKMCWHANTKSRGTDFSTENEIKINVLSGKRWCSKRGRAIVGNGDRVDEIMEWKLHSRTVIKTCWHQHQWQQFQINLKITNISIMKSELKLWDGVLSVYGAFFKTFWSCLYLKIVVRLLVQKLIILG